MGSAEGKGIINSPGGPGTVLAAVRGYSALALQQARHRHRVPAQPVCRCHSSCFLRSRRSPLLGVIDSCLTDRTPSTSTASGDLQTRGTHNNLFVRFVLTLQHTLAPHSHTIYSLLLPSTTRHLLIRVEVQAFTDTSAISALLGDLELKLNSVLTASTPGIPAHGSCLRTVIQCCYGC